MEHLYAATAACWIMLLLTWPLERWFNSFHPNKVKLATLIIVGIGAAMYVLIVAVLGDLMRGPT